MSPAEWVASILGGFGLIGGAIGFLRSRAAEKSARESAEIARRASDRSIAAAEAAAQAQLRIAEAIEAGRANRAVPSAPSSAVRWRVDQVSQYKLRLTNVGDLAAVNVGLSAIPEDAGHLLRVSERPNLRPSEGLSFGVMRTMGGPQVKSVQVEWTDVDGLQQRDNVRIV